MERGCFRKWAVSPGAVLAWQAASQASGRVLLPGFPFTCSPSRPWVVAQPWVAVRGSLWLLRSKPGGGPVAMWFSALRCPVSGVNTTSLENVRSAVASPGAA